MASDDLLKDVEAVNTLIKFLAKQDLPDITAQHADLIVVCGSSILATVYVAFQALQKGTVPHVLISGGIGHSTVHLYDTIARHPIWHHINTAEGRHEAEVLQDLFLALGAKQGQLLPLELKSLHCGGNASCSKELVDQLGLKVERIIIVQDPTMQLRTHAAFTKWWSDLHPSNILSFSPLVPQVTANADGTGLAFVPETVTMKPPVSQEQLQQWTASQEAKGSSFSDGSSAGGTGGQGRSSMAAAKVDVSLSATQGVWHMERFVSLLLGEVPRLRDAPGGYGPRGHGFVDHVDVPQRIEDAWSWLASRYPQLLRA